MLHIWLRSVDSGPSSGIITVGEVVDLREFNVWVEDLRDTREAVETRVDGLPGISRCFRRTLVLTGYKGSC